MQKFKTSMAGCTIKSGRWKAREIISNKSLLLIDDEADNASINTKKIGSDTSTNKWSD